MTHERREEFPHNRAEAEVTKSVFARRQFTRRDTDRLLEEHERTDDEEKRRKLSRAALETFVSVPLDEERRMGPVDRRQEVETSSAGIPLVMH